MVCLRRFAVGLCLPLLLAASIVLPLDAIARRSHRPSRTLRKARQPAIIGTIGPVSSDVATIGRMVSAGMSMARINLVHANVYQVRRLMRSLRSAVGKSTTGKTRRPLPVMMDLPGGKIRTAPLSGRPVRLKRGDPFIFRRGAKHTSAGLTGLNYPRFNRHVEPGDTILVGDGTIKLVVSSVNNVDVKTRGGTRRRASRSCGCSTGG